MTYRLIDSGEGLKLEQFGAFRLIRPCPQALWRKRAPQEWETCDAAFSRENKKGWTYHKKLPKDWIAEIGGVTFKIAPTDFGHLGAFPEHAALWQSLPAEGNQILNLFAYSGGATISFAKRGAKVCHLDASKGMVDWARENGKMNHVEKAPIRWIVDDAIKFLRREVRRDVRYDGILLDPPTFGRGAKGEVFKIEIDIVPLLELCKSVLSKKPQFVVVSCHTPGVTPLVLEHLAAQVFPKTAIETGEMCLASEGALSIPSGSYAKIIF
ncbi:MAG TPA: class I SAM-dependent methyltransferase [Chlamydiales bacterium]|jgi:23S rRNA (cytosine1962-C5)-methyltransferase|nr:class I SAM-dependent methyltransferase [Chlamydiales bacterium]